MVKPQNNIDSMEEVTYTAFLDYVNKGEIDTIWYSPEDEYMRFVLLNDETRNMTTKEKSEYKYNKDSFMKSLFPGEDSQFREKMLLANINLIVDSYSSSARTKTVINIVQLASNVFLLSFMVVLFQRAVKTMSSDSIEVSKDVPTRFDDVIGHDEIIDDIKFMIDLLKNPHKGDSINVKASKGLLLSGPPGTGKTLIARAMAGEADVPFIYMNASSFIEMYVGMGAKRVRALFKKAREIAPCIVFIDEIDAIGQSRNSQRNVSSEDTQTINALLQEMDGFDPSSGVLVIAATNCSESLDEALTRSGRFDREIVINPPQTTADREKLFKHFLKEIKITDNVNLSKLAKETSGFTGADISAVCNEAALIATMKNQKCVSIDDFEEAIDKKMLKGNRKETENTKDKKIVAIHESGHALMAYLCRKDIARTTICGNTSGVGGYVLHITNEETAFLTKNDFINNIKIAYAGRAAEEILLGKDNITTGARSDISAATNYLQMFVETYGFSETDGLLDISVLASGGMISTEKTYERMVELSKALYAETKNILQNHLNSLTSLANVLFDEETLSGERIKNMLDSIENWPDSDDHYVVKGMIDNAGNESQV